MNSVLCTELANNFMHMHVHSIASQRLLIDRALS